MRHHHGFSLIELMVVVVLIAIMSAMILPEMRGSFEDALLRSTSRTLVNSFNLAYSQAVTVNQLHRVRLDTKKGHYVVEKASRSEDAVGGFLPLRDLPGSFGDLDARISIELRTANEDPQPETERENSQAPNTPSPKEEPPTPTPADRRPTNDGEMISFYPNGTADAVELILKDREGFRLALRINPTTARVHIVELEREVGGHESN